MGDFTVQWGFEAEVLEVVGGSPDSSWWIEDLATGQSQFTDDAVDWIESVANDEGD